MISGVNPKAVTHFVKSISIVGNRYIERNTARKNLSKHIELIQKHVKSKKKLSVTKHIGVMQKLMDDLLKKERKLAGYEIVDERRMVSMEKTISSLEHQLEQERQENAKLRAEYKDKTAEMRKTFSYLKSKLVEFIAEKRDRHKKLDSIHSHIEQQIGKSHYAAKH